MLDADIYSFPLNILLISKMPSWHVLKTSSRRLQRNNFSSSKTYWRRLARCLEDIFKASWRRLCKRSQRRLEEVLKTSWKMKNCYAEDVLKTYWRQIFSGIMPVWTPTLNRLIEIIAFDNHFKSLSVSLSFANIHKKIMKKFGVLQNHRPPTTNRRPTDRSSTNPPTHRRVFNQPTVHRAPATNHWSTEHIRTDPRTSDSQPTNCFSVNPLTTDPLATEPPITD